MNVALLGVIAAAMFATLFLVYQTVESERAQREQVRRTVEVLEELRQVNRSVLSGETGQRGYLITLDRRYLAPYQAGREQIDPALDRIRTLIGEEATARQIELIDQIDALARAKFDEMAESVELLEDGRLLDARRAVLTDEGIESMERLVRAIAEMEDIENEILADHSAEAARSEARVLPLLGALLVLLVLAMFAGTRLVGRAARAEAEAAQAAIVSEARDRADLLARELNHRVKNLFAVILAIVQMSARDKPEAKEVTDSIAQRIRALLTAHEVSQGELERPSPRSARWSRPRSRPIGRASIRHRSRDPKSCCPPSRSPRSASCCTNSPPMQSNMARGRTRARCMSAGPSRMAPSS